MTGSQQCAEVRHALGVYVLGALEPAERSAVRGHLACCHDCREELAGLAGLPALLGRVPSAELARLAPGGEGQDGRADLPSAPALPRLLDRSVRIRQVRRRWCALAAAAVLVIGIAVGAVTDSVRRPAALSTSPQITGQTASARNRVTLASATVLYPPEASRTQLPQASTTQLYVQVGGIAPGTHCQLWVTSSRGQAVAAGAWTVTLGQQGAWYPASASLPAATVRSFEVIAGGKVLVTVLVR